jgi:hypothetical protein
MATAGLMLVVYIHLALGRDNFGALVTTVMKLRAPQNFGEVIELMSD